MNLKNENDIKLFKKFVKMVLNQLKIKKKPIIILQKNKNDLKTTASYSYGGDEQVIRVNCKNRALVDCMRSVAHELVHHKQFESGRLIIKPKDIGGDIEDEANSKAGIFIKIFGRKYKQIYDL